MQRQFMSGSRQAPDPFDQYLEENNYYRKHTARDSSCLFRTISEQMYDTQLHHLIIRKKCVSYMRRNRDYFQSQVDGDLDEYLDDMSKPKTYGTLVELQAVAFIYERNVFLFEPYTLGKYFSYREHYKKMFRVFYTPERHFDSVFTSDYIKNVAICQSICYEILYKDLFKLPDVTFAVEQMLHSSSLETTSYSTECNEDGYCTRIYIDDGRVFEFDLPENTCCILENYHLCHFHNPDFPKFSEDLQQDLKNIKREDNEHKFLCKTVDSLLPDKYISCVRQLLLEGITPFPYKVAKALDPNMYRNIEFDAWNEARKELKFQNWYNGDSNFKVGAKCHVKLSKSETGLYTCHIQEISVEKGYCIVFVEQLGEKRLVPYESLQPLPPDQFKPWTLPYRLQRHLQKCNTYRYDHQFNYRVKVDEQFTTNGYCLPEMKSSVVEFDDGDPKQQNCIYKLKQFTRLENFRSHTMEYCTMPLTVEHVRDNMQDNKSQRNDSSRTASRCSDIQKQEFDRDTTGLLLESSAEQESPPENQGIYPTATYVDEYFSYSFDPSIIQAGPQAIMPAPGTPLYYMCNAPGYPQYMQAPPPPQMISTTQSPGGFYPQYYTIPSNGGSSGGYSVTPSIQRRQSNTTPLTGRINLDVKKSVKANGSDLPPDVATVRYFFNLGVEYHQKSSRNTSIDSGVDSKDGIVRSPPDLQANKLDENGNNIDIKPEVNNCSTSSANNSTTSNYSSSRGTNNTQRRFASRYFNNKDRQNFRPNQQNNRYHQNDYNGSNRVQKTNYNLQSQHSGSNSISSMKNGTTNGNHPPNVAGGGNQLSMTDLGVQPSPMITFGTAENCDILQTPTSYNSNGQVVTSYVNSYVQDFDQPPPQPGVYMPVQVAPPQPYVYAPPMGVPPGAMHSAAGYSYLSAPPPTALPLHSPVTHAGPPPSSLPPAYFTPSNSESGGTTLIDGPIDPNQFSCIGYPPPVQFYYSASNGLPTPTGQPAGTPGLGPQGYWCLPPPIQTHPSPQPQPTLTMMPSTNQPTPNRRDNQPKQHLSTGEQQ